jgi:putative hydrolase of HD superfamily
MNPLKFPFEFAQFAGHLKFVKRAGWLRFAKIKSVESVCDHSYRMSLLSCLCLQDFNVDLAKCLRMSLVHDLAESVVGDITPYDGVPKEEKQKKEEEAMTQISLTLNKEMGELLINLWKEYEDGVSMEAQVVKDLDKYEMLLQAYEYEMKYGEDLGEFFDSVKMIKHPRIREWANELIGKRGKVEK